MEQLKVSSSPHIRAEDNTSSIMLDVVIALIPAMIGGVYFFGIRALVMILVSVIACVGFEYLYEKVFKRPVTVRDLSAAVTGILLALNMPVAAPYWMVVVGAFVAIIMAKQLFGGIGFNFINPALAARAFLLASWPVSMTTWTNTGSNLAAFGLNTADIVTGATPLAIIKNGGEMMPDALNVATGNICGCIGETSVILIAIGAIYLIIRKIIKWQIPVVFIATVFVMTYFFSPQAPQSLEFAAYYVCCGGLMLGACFMATDYTTTPMTLKGQIVFAAGCGIITAIIRMFGGYPEGVSYSILLMNLLVPVIDKYMKPRVFGRKGGAK